MKRLFIFLFFLASPAWATTYYVNKSGSDANSCATAQSATDADAKLTIAGGSGGISCLAAGDTLLVGDGTYTEQINNTIPAGSSCGAQTTVRAENDPTVGSKGQITANAILRPSGVFGVILITHANVKIRGFEIDATNADGPAIDGVNGSVTFACVTIEYNRLHGANNGGDPGGMSGLIGDFATSTIAHNEIDHNGDTPGGNSEHGIYTPGPSNTIEYNYVHDNESYCLSIYPYPASSNIIRGNRCESNDARGIVISGDNNQIYNNIEDSDNWGTEIAGYNNLIYNNTFYNNGHGAGGIGRECVVFTSGGSGNQAKNNICYLNEIDSIEQNGGTATEAFNLEGVNPSFTSVATGDFSIGSGSAAYNAGTDLSATLGVDIIGTVRPFGPAFDVGAYEFNGGGGGGGTCDTTDTSGFDGSEDPLSEGGCWTVTGGSGATKVSGFAQAKATGEYTDARWTPSTSMPSDHYETLVWNFNTSASWDAYQAIRITSPSASPYNGYQFHMGSGGNWELNRIDSSVNSLLASGTTTWTAVETIRFQALGSIITVVRNGTTLATVMDATYSGAGFTVGFGPHAVTALTDIKVDTFEVGATSGGSGTITCTSPELSSIQQRPANVTVACTTTGISSGTVDLHYSFDNFTTSYLIAQGVAYNGFPFVFTPTWPAQATMKIRVCQTITCGDTPTFVTRGQYLK